MAHLLITGTDGEGNSGSVTVEVVKGGNGTPLSGDVSGTFGDAYISGDVNLTGDLIIEGLLTGVDTFTLEGNGFQLLFQNRGRPHLAGVEKTAWMRWGETPVGWQTGDRVAVAPTKVGVYTPSEILWGAARPTNSPDVTLVDDSVAKPEVVNLSQTIVLKNLRRIHFHDGAGVATLKWLRVLDSGTTGVLAEYPIHFHLNGDSSRGSLLEGVVVENGKNHAFVPHGSHGITFKDCVAYKTKDDAFWWDRPLDIHHTANNTNDNVYDRCMVLGLTASTSPISVRLTGFQLLAGNNNTCINCVASCVTGGTQSSGFHWPEHSGANDGGAAWTFDDNLSHNNAVLGLFNWQNDHVYEHFYNRFTSYRNGRGGVMNGAYRNDAQFRHITSTQDGTSTVSFSKAALFSFANPERENAILYEDYLTDGPLFIAHSPFNGTRDVIARRATWTHVTVQTEETVIKWRFEDCGLRPADFTITSIGVGSVLRLLEGGVETHSWQNGVWS